jgi:hypothetical protein
MTMRPALLLILLLAVPLALGAQSSGASKNQPRTYSIPLPRKADFSAFAWLIGEWSGKTIAKSPQGDVHLSVAPDLGGSFLIFRETVKLAATDSGPAEDELWMGVLSAGNADNEFTLWVYSSTGFITRYRVTVQKAEIRFMPEGGEAPPPGWLFRRVIARVGPGEVTDTVEAAPPEGSFFQYYSAKLAQQAAEKVAPAPGNPVEASPTKPPASAGDKPH